MKFNSNIILEMKIDLKIPNLGEAEDTEIIEVSISKVRRLKKMIL